MLTKEEVLKNKNLLCVYAGIDRIVFIFSNNLDSREILFGGDQQKIISYFVSECYKFLSSNASNASVPSTSVPSTSSASFHSVWCNIVELNTQSKVLAYIQHIVFKSHQYFEKTGVYIKSSKSSEFDILDKIPNMKDIDFYRKFFFNSL